MNKKLIFSLMFGMILLFGILPNLSALIWNSTSVVSYFPFNETSGSTLLDSTQRADSTIFNSPTQGVTGKIGTAYNFTDGTQYVYLGKNLFDFQGADNFTMSVWVYMPKYTGTDFIFAHENAPDRQYSFGIDSQKLYIETNAGAATAAGNTAIPLGQWNHLVYVVNGTNLVVYLNGVQDGIGARASINDGTDTNGTIGQREFDGNFYQGLLDELGIWNRSLNSTEITDLYNEGDGLSYGQEPAPPSSLAVTLNYPTNDSTQLINYTAFYANIQPAGSINSTNETIRIWYPNGTLFKEETNLTYSDSNFTVIFNLTGFTYGQRYWWNVFAYGNDSTIYYATNNYTFTASAFTEDKVDFNYTVLETTSQNYKIELTAISSVSGISGRMWFNGTPYTSTIQDGTGGGKYNLSNSIIVPLQNYEGNLSLFWQVDFTLITGETLQQNTTTYSQEVNRTILINCNATYATQFVNFTSKNAENPFPEVNATFKMAYEWYAYGGDGSVTRNMTFEDVTETNQSWAFCGNYNKTFVTTAQVEYDATNFALNGYYLQEASLTNDTNYINLYLLNDSKATATVLLVREEQTQNPIEDALIQIQLYDVGTGTFYTVGMGKTSYAGEDLAYLNWYNSLYKFVITKNGETLKVTNTTRILETPQIFDIESTTTFSYDKFRDFQYTLIYNPTTQNFVLTFTKPSGLVDQGCLRVIKRTAKNDTQITLTCETSSSATLYSNIASYGNGTYVATFYATGSWFLIDTISQKIGGGFAESIYDSLSSSDRLFYSFLFGILVVAMFAVTPVLAVVGALLAILGSAALGFSLIEYVTFFGIVIVGGLIIWFVKR